MRAAVVTKSQYAVAFAAEEPTHLAARVAMIDTQRPAGSLADGTGAILPLPHRVVIGDRNPVDLPVALPALPFALARAVLVAKGAVGAPPDTAALVDVVPVRLAVAPPG